MPSLSDDDLIDLLERRRKKTKVTDVRKARLLDEMAQRVNIFLGSSYFCSCSFFFHFGVKLSRHVLVPIT